MNSYFEQLKYTKGNQTSMVELFLDYVLHTGDMPHASQDQPALGTAITKFGFAMRKFLSAHGLEDHHAPRSVAQINRQPFGFSHWNQRLTFTPLWKCRQAVQDTLKHTADMEPPAFQQQISFPVPPVPLELRTFPDSMLTVTNIYRKKSGLPFNFRAQAIDINRDKQILQINQQASHEGTHTIFIQPPDQPAQDEDDFASAWKLAKTACQHCAATAEVHSWKRFAKRSCSHWD